MNNYEEKIKLLNEALSKSDVFDVDMYKNNPKDIPFHTGFPDHEVLLLCYNLVRDKYTVAMTQTINVVDLEHIYIYI